MTIQNSIPKELSTIADRLHDSKSVAILRADGSLDILKSEHVEMLVTALHAFTKTKDEVRDYSVTSPEDMGPDRGD